MSDNAQERLDALLAIIEEHLPVYADTNGERLGAAERVILAGAALRDAGRACVPARPQLPAASSSRPVDPAYPHVKALYALRDDLRPYALLALRAGQRRAAAALLVEMERAFASDPRALLQVRLALNHLPTAWVVACRAIEDAIAAGGPHALREATRTGDPAVLMAAARAAEKRCREVGLPQAAQHAGEAAEAAEREAGDGR